MLNIRRILVTAPIKQRCSCYCSGTSSKIIRQQYLDYFVKEHGHVFVRSSPVIPYCDSTVPFVNAGMNQFKGIFLGKQTPNNRRVANYQKCVRVGGKHNDLSVVGTDGHHHTFFEMLGNWSFGDYFKRDACEMAWNLLTGPYGLRPEHLYVTYFSGDPELSIGPDLECKDIWKCIGVPDSHIIPFGVSDNFWEMGSTGPCGPCTEIHMDHRKRGDRSECVNKGYSDLTELWNIVFIQYNRLDTGKIESLPQCHVDTGMGFERLVALLQNKTSNYDTDLFVPIFETIHKICPHVPAYSGHFDVNDTNGIDTAYRILADHARMITVCLSDGMLPEENYKLRRVIRRAMSVGEKVFNRKEGLLNEVYKTVTDILGEAYPEMHKNFKQVSNILKYEEEIFRKLRKDSASEWNKIINSYPNLSDLVETPGLISGIREIEALQKSSSVPSNMAFKLYDTYGIDEETIETLFSEFKLQLDKNSFKSELDSLKLKTKQNGCVDNSNVGVIESLKSLNIKRTDDSFKYSYECNDDVYEFKTIGASLLAAIQNGQIVTDLEPNVECGFVFDKTCFYSEAGGQECDKGTIVLSSGEIFYVNSVSSVDGYIIHNVVPYSRCNIKNGDLVTLKIDRETRIAHMRNHTATHLLSEALKKVLSNSTTGQKSSKVSAKELKFTAFVYGESLTTQKVKELEERVNRVIENKISLETEIIDSQSLLKEDNVTLVLGEVYPESGIRLVRIKDSLICSQEPCCGTHVRNTAHLEHFCITSFKPARCSASFTAVTGSYAHEAFVRGRSFLERVKALENSEADADEIDKSIQELKQSLKEEVVPFIISVECSEILKQLSKTVKDSVRNSLRELVDAETATALEEAQRRREPWVVLYLRSSSVMESVPLQRATRFAPEIPMIVVAMSDGEVKARCHVPENFVSSTFNAQKWLEITVASVFKSQVAAPRGQDPNKICNMKGCRVKPDDWDALLPKALDQANSYARQCMSSQSKHRST